MESHFDPETIATVFGVNLHDADFSQPLHGLPDLHEGVVQKMGRVQHFRDVIGVLADFVTGKDHFFRIDHRLRCCSTKERAFGVSDHLIVFHPAGIDVTNGVNLIVKEPVVAYDQAHRRQAWTLVLLSSLLGNALLSPELFYFLSCRHKWWQMSCEALSCGLRTRLRGLTELLVIDCCDRTVHGVAMLKRDGVP